MIQWLLFIYCVSDSFFNSSLNPHHNPMRYNEILGITSVPVLYQQPYKLFKLAPYHV